MTATATFPMLGERDKQFALRYIEKLPLDGKNEVIVRRIRRTTKQERRLRSMIKAIMDAETEFGGRTWESDDWREILLSAYFTEKRQEHGIVLEGMGGEFLILGRRRGSDLDVEEFGELMTMTLAWIDQHGIVWEERDDGKDPRPEPPPEAYQ